MDCSTPGLPVHHQLPELAQTHVHRVGDAIQPSHLLSSPSPPAFSLSQCSNIELHKCYAISRVQLVSGLAIAVAVALPLGFNSANINWASLLHVLCRNTKINKTRHLSSRRLQSRGTIFIVIFLLLLPSFISSKFTIYISLYYSEFSCPPYHKVAIFIALNWHFLIQGSLRLLKYIFPLPQPLIPKAVTSLVSSFLVASSSLLPWLLVSSYSIQLAFTMRLPLPPGLPSPSQKWTFIRFYRFVCRRTNFPAEKQ